MRFGDDVVLLNKNVVELEKTMNKLNEGNVKVGLTIYVEKTDSTFNKAVNIIDKGQTALEKLKYICG